MTRFYVWWMLFYYVFIFVFMKDYLQTRSYSTLYDRVAGNQMKSLFSNARVARLPDLVKAKTPLFNFFLFFSLILVFLQKAVYMCVHLVFASFTMAVATMLFYSWQLHVLFLLTMISMSAFNASSFYKAQFLQDAAEEASKKK